MERQGWRERDEEKEMEEGKRWREGKVMVFISILSQAQPAENGEKPDSGTSDATNYWTHP